MLLMDFVEDGAWLYELISGWAWRGWSVNRTTPLRSSQPTWVKVKRLGATPGGRFFRHKL